jgi:Fic family protein
MWIHEYKNWTTFFWDTEKLTFKLSEIRHRQGLLLGKMKGLGFELKQEANLNTLTNDVIKSSAIEGQNLNLEEVRSSIARRLGIDIADLVPASRDVEGIVEMMLDATQNFNAPLTKKRMFDWHAALFPTRRSGMHKITVAGWRTKEAGAMQVVSGPMGHETVHFEAPDAGRLNKETQDFFKWFNNEDGTDPVLRAGIAHLWFVTLHPFEDGNGRIARAIADMALARADGTSNRFYSMSTQIEKERKDYYNNLEQQQRGTPDITPWLEWFLDCLSHAISNAEDTLSTVLYKQRLWNKVNQEPVNKRQRIIINRMLENDFKGHMNTSKYAKMTKCSSDTALRDIQELKKRSIFIQNPGGGRSTSYRLTEDV